MASVLSAAVLLGILGWVAARRRFVIWLMLFVWISFVWRLLSNVFIDVMGPLYAVELGREIGGGNASVVLAIAHVVFLAALAAVFRPTRLRALAHLPIGSWWSTDTIEMRHESAARVVLAVSITFALLLYVDLLRIGIIPLIAGIERYIYTLQYGGVFHGLLVKYNLHIAFGLGMFYAWGVLRSGRPDNRFLGVLFLLFAYLLLVGNRFSAFYGSGTFFLIPFAAVKLRQQFGDGRALNGASLRGRPLTRLLQVGAVAVVVAVMVSALVWSLTVTRGFDRAAAIANTVHRIAVIQGELWSSTYERVLQRGDYDPARAIQGVFLRPIAPDRNTTVPYLMELDIGEDVYPILAQGAVYTGGYPEVLFELLGPVGAFAGVFVMGWILASFVFALLAAIIRMQCVRAFLVFYVMFPFLLFPVSGMLNVFVGWRFWVKAAVLLLWVLYEEWRSLGRTPAMGGQLESAQAPG